MNDPASKVIADVDAFLSSFDRKNKTIVFTNGCFDLLHKGHLYLLSQAKNAGDILIVGVNNDASVRRLKGDERPIENVTIRMQKLAQLSEVDFVIPFSEDTPLYLIQKIQPGILVKGGDYKAEEIVGADIVKKNGGKVIIIPLLEGFSTTEAIRSPK